MVRTEQNWENSFHFFWRFIHNPLKIGALRPSSAQLCRATVKAIEPEKCRCVVELGPGTGVITQYLLNSIDPQSRFLAVEIDPVFHENLQKRFPGTAIHRDDAEDLGKWLQPQKSGLADAVVSGLPWTLFTESQCRSILAEIASCMQPDGIFVTLCYWHAQWLPSGLRLKKLLKDYFDAVEMTDTVWTNVPPIFLFRCSGRRLTPKKEKR